MADQTFPLGGSLDVTPSRLARETFWEKVTDWITTVDHKKLGLMYIIYATIFLLVGGAEAIIIRVQLAYPGNHFISPEVYNRMFTMHGTTMVFLMGMPLL